MPIPALAAAQAAGQSPAIGRTRTINYTTKDGKNITDTYNVQVKAWELALAGAVAAIGAGVFLYKSEIKQTLGLGSDVEGFFPSPGGGLSGLGSLIPGLGLFEETAPFAADAGTSLVGSLLGASDEEQAAAADIILDLWFPW